jgi:hypothetical protein
MKFYVLKPEGGLFGTKWAYADKVDPVVVSKEAENYCPVCGRPVGRLKWLPPHRVKLSSGDPAKWGDFVWGAGFLLLVSDRFKAAYEKEGLTGITVFYPPVEIVRVGRRKRGDLPAGLPAYHLIEVVWGGADQDDVASKVVSEREPPCSYCRGGRGRFRQEGIILKEGSWTGVDIFTPRGSPVPIMVSERFKEVVEKYGLKGAWFIPAEKFGYDDSRPGLWYILD